MSCLFSLRWYMCVSSPSAVNLVALPVNSPYTDNISPHTHICFVQCVCCVDCVENQQWSFQLFSCHLFQFNDQIYYFTEKLNKTLLKIHINQTKLQLVSGLCFFCLLQNLKHPNKCQQKLKQQLHLKVHPATTKNQLLLDLFHFPNLYDLHICLS